MRWLTGPLPRAVASEAVADRTARVEDVRDLIPDLGQACLTREIPCGDIAYKVRRTAGSQTHARFSAIINSCIPSCGVYLHENALDEARARGRDQRRLDA